MGFLIFRELRQREGSPIYLCGGSVFATWLLENELIDTVKLKLNPFIQGCGAKLFGDTAKAYRLELLTSERYEAGLQIMSYRVLY